MTTSIEHSSIPELHEKLIAAVRQLGYRVTPLDANPDKLTLDQVAERCGRIIPHGDKCHGCPKSDPHGIEGYTGDVFCHLFEEVMPDGNKDCGINQDMDEKEEKANSEEITAKVAKLMVERRECCGCDKEIEEDEILFGASDGYLHVTFCQACWDYVNSSDPTCRRCGIRIAASVKQMTTAYCGLCADDERNGR